MSSPPRRRRRLGSCGARRASAGGGPTGQRLATSWVEPASCYGGCWWARSRGQVGRGGTTMSTLWRAGCGLWAGGMICARIANADRAPWLYMPCQRISPRQ
jgi:hypothetical protein